MKIEKITKLNVEFDNSERAILNEAAQLLARFQKRMEQYDCNTLMCCDEYTYDIVDVRDIIDALERFEEISEIFS